MSGNNFLTENPAIYERWFPDPEHRAARFVDDLLGRFGGGRDLLDIGCGTGRDARFWSANGYRVTGLDTSPEMIEHARAHTPSARFCAADMREFALPTRFDVITCLDSALLYCHTNADLDAFLRRCHAHLRPGGLLVAEARNGAYFLGNPDSLGEPAERELTFEGVHHQSRTVLWIDHAAQLLRRERTWTRAGVTEPAQHSAWRLLFPQELRYLCAVHDFEVLALFDGPGPRTDPPWHADAEFSDRLSGDRVHLVARRGEATHALNEEAR